jgi:hypothetical protein
MRWVGHVEPMREQRNAYKILFGILNGWPRVKPNVDERIITRSSGKN